MIELKRYYVYVLKSEVDGSWYIGYTEDIENRIQQHNNGESLYTKRKIPWRIIYYEVSFDKYDAIAREKYLKTGMGRRYLKNRLKNQLNF
jgi:putative endonuclease